MSLRGLPLKLLVVGFGALFLLARIQISDDARKLLLIAWIVVFYAALTMWDSEERGHAFREALRQDRQAREQAQDVDEFFDADRINMQREHSEAYTQIDDHWEIV